MNGRKAKVYRKLAVGNEHTTYKDVELVQRKAAKNPWLWTYISTKDKQYVNYGSNQDPKFIAITNTIKLDPTCKRATTKLLKRIGL